MSQKINVVVTGTQHFVIDGGYLINRVLWPRGNMFDKILNLCGKYLERRYIVFDSYKSGSTLKEVAHTRRTSNHSRTEVKINKNFVFNEKKTFLVTSATRKIWRRCLENIYRQMALGSNMQKRTQIV